MRNVLCAVILAVYCQNLLAAELPADCTLINCPSLSINEILVIKSHGIKELFFPDRANIEAFKKQYDSSIDVSRIDFETWYLKEMDFKMASFKHQLQYMEENTAKVQLEFKVKIPKQFRVGEGQGEELLTEKSCVLVTKTTNIKKECNAQRRTCDDQQIFFLLLGGNGSQHCQEAYSSCTFTRDFDVLLKSEQDGQVVLTPVSLRAEGNYSEGKHYNILTGMAKKARIEFEQHETSIIQKIEELPKCNI
ncbi:MAG TPA: hypothetical protein VNJ08_03975 [Bacteriovoracaceae bacterium]|nr:hypothetical protein [Bacteriovoracaceae bacterium]